MERKNPVSALLKFLFSIFKTFFLKSKTDYPIYSFGLTTMSSVRRFSLTLITLLSISLVTWGQVNGDYRTRAAGNWNANGTWQVYSGGWNNCAAGDYPGVAAGAGTVTLTNNVTFNVSPANSIGALVLQANLTPNATRSLTVTGNVTLTSGTLNLSNNNGTQFTLTYWR